MTLQTPTRDVPHEGRLLEKIHADLRAFVAQLNGSAFIADTPTSSLYHLANGPGQFVVTIHISGDFPVFGGGPKISDPVIEPTIVVRIMANAGFDVDKSASVASDKPGSRALLWIVSEIRRRILSYRISPEVINNGELYYAGKYPLTLPDGEPLAGFELRFTCFMQMSLEASDGWETIQL